MKRFDLNERVKPVEIPNKSGSWGQTAKYEPYERVVKAGKYYLIVQQVDNDKMTFYLEHRYTKQRVAQTKADNGLMALDEINQSFTDYEQRPIEFQTATPPQQKKPELQPEQSDYHKKLDEQLAAMEKSIAESKQYMKSKEDKYNAAIARQKVESLKENISELEAKLGALTPRENDTEEPADQPA